jgi:hypothetical protein
MRPMPERNVCPNDSDDLLDLVLPHMSIGGKMQNAVIFDSLCHQYQYGGEPGELCRDQWNRHQR